MSNSQRTNWKNLNSHPATSLSGLARKMWIASQVFAKLLPSDLYHPVPINILLMLASAEEDGALLPADQLCLPGAISALATDRWVTALGHAGLIERQSDMLTLTDAGCEMMVLLLEGVQASLSAGDHG